VQRRNRPAGRIEKFRIPATPPRWRAKWTCCWCLAATARCCTLPAKIAGSATPMLRRHIGGLGFLTAVPSDEMTRRSGARLAR